MDRLILKKIWRFILFFLIIYSGVFIIEFDQSAEGDEVDLNEIYNNEAITTLLIHPSDSRKKTYKLEAQEGLIKNAKRAGAWIGDLTTFGEYWRERDEVRFDTSIENKYTLVIRVNKSQGDLNSMIGFVVEDTGDIKRVVVEDLEGSPIPFLSEKRNGKLFIRRNTGAHQ